MTYTRLAAQVRAHLSQDRRYEHTVRVARCADVLAQRHGADAARARLSGMLHDLARLFPAVRLVAECESRRMPIDAFERAHPIVLHARLGAALAREAFAIHDPAVLSAIAKHTLAAPAMSRLDCVVYLADGLEPGRTFAERDGLWELALRDLDGAMRAMLAATLRAMARKGMAVAPQTLAAARHFGVDLQEVTVSAN